MILVETQSGAVPRGSWPRAGPPPAPPRGLRRWSQRGRQTPSWEGRAPIELRWRHRQPGAGKMACARDARSHSRACGPPPSGLDQPRRWTPSWLPEIAAHDERGCPECQYRFLGLAQRYRGGREATPKLVVNAWCVARSHPVQRRRVRSITDDRREEFTERPAILARGDSQSSRPCPK
jgi:hypothetical protein